MIGASDIKAMKVYGGVDVWIHIFLTSVLAGGEWPVSRLGRFTLWERAPNPIGWEVLWTPEEVWRCGEEKILEPTGTRTPTSRSSSTFPVAIPTELYRLPETRHVYQV
jgi:hypothetical protein